MNKRQKKKKETNKPTVQEAWDVITEHLVKRQEDVICFFVRQTLIDDYITMSNADGRVISMSTKKLEQIESELKAKGEIY